MNQSYAIAKRGFDIAFSCFALLFLSPLFLLIVVLIRIESKGGTINSSKRVGQYYKIFNLFKFRTRSVNANQKINQLAAFNLYNSSSNENYKFDECPMCKHLNYNCSPILYKDNGVVCENLFLMHKGTQHTFYKIKEDTRETRVGKFLRKTNLDELPQLVNVLLGDISIIGNRPLPLNEAEKLTVDFAIDRFNSPAGIFGLWQVQQRRSAKISAKERIALDVEYARNWSLKLDALIFFKTLPVAITVIGQKQ